MRKHLLAGLAALALLGSVIPASATLIVAFGQAIGGNTISGTANAGGTTWGGLDIPVTITQIDAINPTPIAAFLDVTATSTAAGATLIVGPPNLIVEHFTGSFSINRLADNSGINFLSGTFNDGALTAQGATAIAVFAPSTTFNSDVITALDLPRSLSFALTNVAPAVDVVAALGTTSGLTIQDFNASVAGDASANIPEPTSMAVLGAGLLGLGWKRRRG
jgi:hypothetical protein